MENNSYIVKDGVYWKGVLKGVKKHNDKFQPIYEAFTNALESIALRPSENMNTGKVVVSFNYASDMLSDTSRLISISVEDNGVGFDDTNFTRLLRYKDTTKGYNNRGSGRLQYLHYFETTQVNSAYKDGDELKEISFKMSKSTPFLTANSIVYFQEIKDLESGTTGTKVEMINPIENKDQNIYRQLTLEDFKAKILSRYMLLFCVYREEFPQIIFRRIKDDAHVIDELTIEAGEIPQIDNETTFHVRYSLMSEDFKRIDKQDETETFNIKAFKIGVRQLEKNEIKLTSKNEVVEGTNFKLSGLSQEDHIDGNRFLFLVSSNFIDELDEDARGDFELLNKTDFKKRAKEIGSSEPSILIDDIEEGANTAILSIYEEIRAKEEEHEEHIEELKQMFLLNDETVQSLKFSINDTEEKILEKVYQADAKLVADRDANLKQQIEKIDELDPRDADYQERLNEQVSEFVKTIPLQNRTALTQYVARRELVLRLFERILLQIRQGESGIDESVFHNLIFQQHSRDSYNSDLWLLNEEFIYFKGSSEEMLANVQIDGVKVFRDEFNDAEQEYIRSLGENRLWKRPDVLLFPEEGKCIIIEFKSHDVNLADNLAQINKYAGLIHNFCTDEIQINTFYGYLVGEAINPTEVRQIDPNYVRNYKFNFLFRPNFPVLGELSSRPDGSLYTEVIQYSVLLERAIMRNKVFIEKLKQKIDSTSESIELEEVTVAED
jgi:hypothetical protein